MKKIIMIPIIMLIAFFSSVAFAQSNSDVPFEQTKEWSKLGDSLKDAWTAAKKSGDMTQRFDCFVRVEPPFDDGDQSFLFSKGFVIRAVSGPVATGHLKAADLPDVAKLPFVSSIKLSKTVN